MALTAEQKARLGNIFDLGGVSKEELTTWILRLEEAPEEIASVIIALFELYPEEIGWFSGLQVRKEKALAEHDQEEWRAILEEEKEHIQKFIPLNA